MTGYAQDVRDMLEALRTTSNGMRDLSNVLTITILNNSQSVRTDTVMFRPGY